MINVRIHTQCEHQASQARTTPETKKTICLKCWTLGSSPRAPQKRRLAIFFAGPVARARSQNPIPSRTRPLNFSALMVLCLKTRESRSLPGQSRISLITIDTQPAAQVPKSTRAALPFQSPRTTWTPIQRRKRPTTPDAGWSSPVARQAHNLKVVSSNLAPATKSKPAAQNNAAGFLCAWHAREWAG
jgi:hypothetical protein